MSPTTASARYWRLPGTASYSQFQRKTNPILGSSKPRFLGVLGGGNLENSLALYIANLLAKRWLNPKYLFLALLVPLKVGLASLSLQCGLGQVCEVYHMAAL